MASGRKPDLERRRQIADWRAEGLSLNEIGQRLGIRRQAVHQIVKATEKGRHWGVTCQVCGTAIAAAAVLPRETGDILCLLCLEKRPDSTFGQRLRTFRLAVGLTRTELARLAEIRGSAVQHYEEDRIIPTRVRQDKLAEALGVPLEILGVNGAAVPGRRGRPRKQKK